MITLYGLKSCDSCRKARRSLDRAGVAFTFVDLRETPPSEAQISEWAGALGWQNLLTRRSTTWRGLDEAERRIGDRAGAVAAMQAHPTLIKRPVIEVGDKIISGLTEEMLAKLPGT